MLWTVFHISSFCILRSSNKVNIISSKLNANRGAENEKHQFTMRRLMHEISNLECDVEQYRGVVFHLKKVFDEVRYCQHYLIFWNSERDFLSRTCLRNHFHIFYYSIIVPLFHEPYQPFLLFLVGGKRRNVCLKTTLKLNVGQ